MVIVAINAENNRLNLIFIHWSKEDLKQQDLMKNLVKALFVNLQY